MRGRLQDDFYRLAFSASWPVFFAALGAGFVGLNVVFAGLYGLDAHGVAGARHGSFVDLFFFSVETFATVGYGDMIPRTVVTRLVATGEAFASITSLALATGMIFTRFSRSDARVVFAPVVACAAVSGRPTLLVKLGNRRRDPIVQARARLWVVWRQDYEGTDGRRFLELALDKSEHPEFREAWTLFHTIDPASPLHGQDAASLGAAEAEFLVTLRGTDHRTSQIVTARHDYAAKDVVWNRRFRSGPDLRRDRRRGSCLDFELVDAASTSRSKTGSIHRLDERGSPS